MTLNKYAYLVIKWLDDKDSVTAEELGDAMLKSRSEASATVWRHGYPNGTGKGLAMEGLIFAVDIALHGAIVHEAGCPSYIDSKVKEYINKYFEYSGQNKQNYIDALSLDINDIEFAIDRGCAERDLEMQVSRAVFDRKCKVMTCLTNVGVFFCLLIFLGVLFSIIGGK